MKKISIFLALILSLSITLTACGNASDSSSGSGDDTSTSETTVTGDTTIADSNGDANVPKPEGPKGDYVTSISTEMSQKRYAYNTLNDAEKSIYNSILKGVKDFSPTIKLDKPITSETFRKIFGMIYFQETQLFWLDGALETFEGESDTVNVYYRASKEDAELFQGQLDTKVKELIDSFPANATTVDKLKILHDYLVFKNEFTKDTPMAQTIFGAIVEGKTQCEGYAKAMGYLCDMAGIENMLITGENEKRLSHAWNLVKVDGDWYNIDATFDDPVGSGGPEFIRYNYFNVPNDEIIDKSHFIDTTYYTPPAATATKANYHRTYGLYAESYEQAIEIVKSELTKISKDKTTLIQIKMSSDEVYNKVMDELVTKTGIFKVIKELNETIPNKFVEGKAFPTGDSKVRTLQIGIQY